MFGIGDYVVYGDDGVCRVADVGKLAIRSSYAARQAYYTLKPLFYKGTIYAPVNEGAPMRSLITPEAARDLMRMLPQLAGSASYASDKKQLADHYRRLLEPGTCFAFAQAAKGIYEKYHAPGKGNKLPGAVEMQYFKRATELLVQELSVALDEPMEAVQAHIEQICGMETGQAQPRSNPR